MAVTWTYQKSMVNNNEVQNCWKKNQYDIGTLFVELDSNFSLHFI